MANFNSTKFRQRMNKLRGTKKNVMVQAYQYFKSITPVDTGVARKNTKLVNYKIVADYAYAFVLDLGRHMTKRGMRGSKQAPQGMSKPTIKKFGEWVKKFIRGI